MVTKTDYSRAGWYLLAALIVFSPLIQGGSPRLPAAIVQSAILLLAALWALEWGWLKPFQSFRLTLTDGLLSFFLFLALFSYLFSPYQHASLRSLFVLVTCSLLYWYLVFHGSRRGIDIFLGAVIAQGALQAILIWHGWAFGEGPRPSGTFYNPNFAASFTAAASLAALGRAVLPRTEGPARRAAAGAGALFMAGAVLVTQSRGGVLALFGGAVVLLAGRSLKLVAGLTAGGAAALLVLPNPFLERLTNLSTMDVYAWSRISIWKSALKMMHDHPWFGVGLGQYKYFSPRYAFPVDAHWAKYSRVAEVPHNEYLHAGAELGLPGLAVCLAALVLAGMAFFGALRRTSRHDRPVLITLAAMVTVILAHSAVDFPLHAPPLALLFVASAAGLRILGAEGPSWVVEFRFRRVYALAFTAALLGMVYLSARPVAAFSYFLGGIGAPQNLLREKWSLEHAAKRDISHQESVALLEKAVALDPGNASYHNALGSRYFNYHFSGGGADEELRKKGLRHGSFALELNPNNYRFAFSLGQAWESLYRLYGEERFLRLAAEEYRLARSLAPKHYAMIEKGAFIEGELGALDDAESGFRLVLELEPNYIRGWYNLGMFMAEQGRVEEALQAFDGGEAVPARVTSEPLVAYEERLLDFDMELFDKARARLGGDGGEEDLGR